MNDLAALQHDFYAWLRGGPIAPVAERVIEQGPATTAVRLGIYANAYQKRLAEALAADHEILGLYLGDALWDRLCTDYIAARPSRTRSLRWFGDGLPQFLASHEPFAAHPLLAELAAFERNLLNAFDAADGARLPWSAVLALRPEDWPGMQIGFHPSVYLQSCHWNTVAIWQALKAGQTPPAAAPLADEHVLLWRDAARITQFRGLVADEAAALARMREAGGDFAALCECLADHQAAEQVPARALALLQRWFDDDLVERLATPAVAPASRA